MWIDIHTWHNLYWCFQNKLGIIDSRIFPKLKFQWLVVTTESLQRGQVVVLQLKPTHVSKQAVWKACSHRRVTISSSVSPILQRHTAQSSSSSETKEVDTWWHVMELSPERVHVKGWKKERDVHLRRVRRRGKRFVSIMKERELEMKLIAKATLIRGLMVQVLFGLMLDFMKWWNSWTNLSVTRQGKVWSCCYCWLWLIGVYGKDLLLIRCV